MCESQVLTSLDPANHTVVRFDKQVEVEPSHTTLPMHAANYISHYTNAKDILAAHARRPDETLMHSLVNYAQLLGHSKSLPNIETNDIMDSDKNEETDINSIDEANYDDSGVF